MNLVIVESPAKAKTLKKYLGKDFEVLASYGHVRDLVPKEGAVDPDNQFAMKYEVIKRNSKHVDAIIKRLREDDALYLATDPDREGEAISWHIVELIKNKRGMKDKPIHRVVFHEITQQAIKEAMANPRPLSISLVNAQQARRSLDYLYGFTLSPLLWKKIRRGLSAGRVQSPALRLIVERELEIERFEVQEYWSIEAQSCINDQSFSAKLIEYQGDKLKQFSITQEKDAQQIKKSLLDKAAGELSILKVEKKKRKRNPSPPFITSTLQQEAVRKLGFTTQRTMRVAQQLFEGIDIAGEAIGLITYMRTDSVHLADDALTEIRAFIDKQYAASDLPSTSRRFKTSAKNAQEAHEAIRPTLPLRTPDEVKDFLEKDHYKLYNLIWKRTIASQMNHATINTMSVDLGCNNEAIFRANGSSIHDPGFMKVYQEDIDDGKKVDDNKLLPDMTEGDTVQLLNIDCRQHFTEPPPRFTEASLVKTLEEFGIGRPSTYASIISTLKQREYVELEKKRFSPTDVGRIVTRFLTEFFPDYVDYEFTAKLEDSLDEIARDEKEWIPVLDRFWYPFKERVNHTATHVKRSDVTQEKLDEKCPKCGEILSIRLGKRGRFIGCTHYPDCDYTRSLDGQESTPPETIQDRTCPKCNSVLQIKEGRYGKFIGCSGYPKCKFIEPLEKPEDTNVTCPECVKGSMMKRTSRRGKVFYSCSRYPDCQYAVWDYPISENCPQCGWAILTMKTTKKHGTEKVCPQKSCSYRVAHSNDDD